MDLGARRSLLNTVQFGLVLRHAEVDESMTRSVPLLF
jgi:hypothetical protein